MKKQINQVAEFQKAVGIKSPKTPTVVKERVTLRNSLLREEVEETCRALEDGNVIEATDGIIDTIYICIGTAYEMGVHKVLPQLFDEVHRSNMSKFDENCKPIFRADGKLMKSDYYFKPDIKFIVENSSYVVYIYNIFKFFLWLAIFLSSIFVFVLGSKYGVKLGL